MNTLIDKAKAYKPIRTSTWHPITPEIKDLAMAWLKDEITMSQAIYAVYGKSAKRSGIGIYILFARAIREIYRKKEL